MGTNIYNINFVMFVMVWRSCLLLHLGKNLNLFLIFTNLVSDFFFSVCQDHCEFLTSAPVYMAYVLFWWEVHI